MLGQERIIFYGGEDPRLQHVQHPRVVSSKSAVGAPVGILWGQPRLPNKRAVIPLQRLVFSMVTLGGEAVRGVGLRAEGFTFQSDGGIE